MTLYVIGSFFPALAARDRVKLILFALFHLFLDGVEVRDTKMTVKCRT
jgi:hypothetical protein